MRPSKTFKILALSVVAASALAAGVAFALPTHEVETYYYSDASHTEEVGHTLLACNGHFFSNGVQTAYADVTSTPCD
ncbi:MULTISPECIES: DUF6289 family protein [Caulobacter]|jgi:hypothetical protein|uniref:Secreted protein n=1 Tax=Caulobacter rhizosphaerae TaxID=2010972 RepID=A0ABU1N0I1_9CAUL|nr:MULTISPECIES: DUF6289 family protein [Caulobacter]KQZ18262.1 hypothetical protein ASD47_10010 [Caulobacter sp. Root1472]MDR6531641.1 hypothetical protein [Caulobacter rhizosphaerae]GGL38818.1 hypothetical protein GCM10010983_39930 [Caulobacter rhizosphaerae]